MSTLQTLDRGLEAIDIVSRRAGGVSPAALADALRYLNTAETCEDPELMAEDLRFAAQALGRITGRIDVEDVLGAIFARFCVGK